VKLFFGLGAINICMAWTDNLFLFFLFEDDGFVTLKIPKGVWDVEEI